MSRRLLGFPAALIVLLALVAGLRLAGSAPNRASQERAPTPSAEPMSKQEVAHARRLLAEVPVKGRAAKSGYSRANFGKGWKVVAGCDARNRTLARDLTDVSFKPGTHNCVVQSGTLKDPYTGTVIHFQRGNQTSALVQIDHRYPLFLAHQQGAQQWDSQEREDFASDPLNLVATAGHINQAKGASGPGSWLPPNKSYRCTYVAEFTAVAHKYGLSMNPGDHRAAEQVLTRC